MPGGGRVSLQDGWQTPPTHDPVEQSEPVRHLALGGHSGGESALAMAKPLVTTQPIPGPALRASCERTLEATGVAKASGNSRATGCAVSGALCAGADASDTYTEGPRWPTS